MYKVGIPKSLVCVCCAIAFGTGFRASAQTPSTNPTFEVASVKPVDPAYVFKGTHFWAHIRPAGASYWYMTPGNLVEYAYGVESYQVTGPEWATHEHFDIEARFSEGADPKDDRRMLQALLKDRFKLTFHIEKRELESYALVVGKHGAKLTPSLPDPVSAATDAPLSFGDKSAGEGTPKVTRNPDGSSTRDMGKGGTQTIKFDKENQAMHYERSKITMEELAQRMRNCLTGGIPEVVDETGIKGTYQLGWDCPSPYRGPIGRDAAGTLPPDPQDGSALTRSLDALGLKIEKRKAMHDIYVIDHVERPSEN